VLSKNVLKKADSFYPNYVGRKKLTIIITPEKKRQEEDELNYHMQQTKNNSLKKEKTSTRYKPKSMGKENQTNLKKERVFQL
jgi:hypothetical protein